MMRATISGYLRAASSRSALRWQCDRAGAVGRRRRVAPGEFLCYSRRVAQAFKVTSAVCHLTFLAGALAIAMVFVALFADRAVSSAEVQPAAVGQPQKIEDL